MSISFFRAFFWVPTVLAMAMIAGPAVAFDSYTSPSGLFRLDLYGKGESFSSRYLKKDAPERQKSLHTLSSWQAGSLRFAARYWDGLLQRSDTPDSPAIFATIVDDDENASAVGMPATVRIKGKKTVVTAPNSIINSNKASTDTIAASIAIGSKLFPASQKDVYKTPIPQNSGVSLAVTMIHEIGHAMGISTDSEQEEEGGIFQFDKPKSAFDSHLYDWRGQRAKPGMKIQTIGHKAPSGTYFDLPGYWAGKGMKMAYFSGPHVREVLEGARMVTYDTNGRRTSQQPVPGLPINGNEAEDRSEDDDADLSHIELRNSMMSHQQWRNYVSFMEAELALLQDLGYNIDRRDYYGRSIYGDNGSIVNTAPFFARNAAGTVYLEGTYNRRIFGIGLHVYGSGNAVRQEADLLTKGIAGVGIRVDGTGNAVTVGSGSRVWANGLNGNGILVSYGKNHRVTIENGASVRALGKGGIGAAFDFGTNLLGIRGEDSAGRASYAARTGYKRLKASSVDVDGPLAGDVLVQGELAGQKAAIHIGRGAYVPSIRIGTGASLSGPVISEWMYSDDKLLRGMGLVPALSMQRQYAGSGELTTRLLFEGQGLSYDGDITGQDNMRLEVSGSLAYAGTASVLSATVRKGAVLSGGTYRLMRDGVSQHRFSYSMNSVQKTLRGVGLFTNDGAFGPLSASIPAKVEGDMKSRGMLFARTDARGHAGITVSGTADISRSKAIALNALPGESYTALTASSVSGSTSNGRSDPLPVSGMLSQYSWKEGNTVRVASMLSDNTGGAHSAFRAAASLFENQPYGVSGREAMRPLFNLDAAGTRTVLASISSNAAARSISLLQQQGQFLPDMLSARLRDVRDRKGGVEGVEDPASHFWMRTGGRWGIQDGGHYRGKFALLGWDRDFAHGWRAGVFGGYGEADLSPSYADASMRGARLGLYAGWQGEHAGALLYGAWSQNAHHLRRSIPMLGLNADARYHSNMAEAGAELKYTVAEKQGWRVAPYAGIYGSHIWQEAYHEHGAGMFSQHVQSASLDQLSGSAGLELSRSLERGGYALRIGGRHVFAGAEPKLSFSLEGDRGHSWLMDNDQDRTFFTMSLDGGFKLPRLWEVSGSMGLESGGHSTHLRCSLLLLKKW